MLERHYPFLIEVLVFILAVIPIVFNISIFLRVQRSPYRWNRLSKLLIVVNNVIVAWIIVSYLQWIGKFSWGNNTLAYSTLVSLELVLGLAALNVMALFVKFLVHPGPDLWQLVFNLSCGAVIAGIAIGMIVAGVQMQQQIFVTLNIVASILFIIATLPIIFFAVRDLQQLLREPLSNQQRDQVKQVLKNGWLAIVAVPLTILTIYDSPLRIPLTYIVLTTVFYYFSKAYFSDPRIAFIIPDRTYLAIISSTEGNLKYRKNFLTVEEEDFSELVSGYLAGFTSMISQFYDNPVRPKSMDFGGKKIMFQWTNEFYIAVFTDYDSPLIREAMLTVIHQIRSRYDDVKAAMDQTKMLELDEVIDEAFYFIY